jgi:glutaminyl-tRNA synthetase
VRLRGSYVIRADEAIKDADGNIVELRCSYDPDTLGKNPEGRKVKGVIHWVPAAASVECEVRLYDRLFRSPNPEKAEDSASFLDNINPDSLQVLTGCRAEPSGQRTAGRPFPVRARRLLRRRYQGLETRSAGIQPYRDPA